jgi:hypothetical protein
MPLIRIELKASSSKKTDHKRVIICACDNCGTEVEKKYKSKTYNDYLSGKLLAFCDRKCLHEATRKNGEMRKKMQETCVNTYGVDDPNKSQMVKDKIKDTCETKYGHRSYLGSDAHKRVMEDFLSEYKVSNISQIPEVQEKIRSSMIARYGTQYPTQSPEIVEKIRRNCSSKFGVSWPSLRADVAKSRIEKLRSAEFKIRRHNTLKASGFYKKQASAGEDALFTLLVERFPLVQRHVNVGRWNIDFYVPEIDTYVNYNGTYWHGKNFTDEKLLESASKQAKTILGTKRRDEERELWFKENNMNLVVVWEDDFMMKPTLDAWFSIDPAIRKQKILGSSEESVTGE